MRLGVRGHDIVASDPTTLCEKLHALGVKEIQLVAHKSFPDFIYNKKNIRELAAVFKDHGIKVAVYGCYIDPLTPEEQARFHEHIRYAKILDAGVIATESAVGITSLQEDARVYRDLVSVFRRFSEDAQAHGVRCAIETVAVHPICSPEKTEMFLNDVGELYAILDPVNLMSSEHDSTRIEKTKRAIELYPERITAIHWKAPIVDASDPAICFAKENSNVTVITEGITGETLTTTIQQFRK